MSNLALLELTGAIDDALQWARRAVEVAPVSAHAQRTLGKVALADGKLDEALGAFLVAERLEPDNLGNHFNLGLVYTRLQRPGEAIPELERCVPDPALGPRATDLLHQLGR